MASDTLPANDGASKILKGMEEYRSTVANLFPGVPRQFIDHHSIGGSTALTLTRFLDCLPHKKLVLLEVGVFLGVSTFVFASHAKVSKVVSVDVNPSLAELSNWGKTWNLDVGSETSTDVRFLDVAAEALARFPEQRRKVQFVTGTTSTVDIPVPADGAPLIAYVDGDHTKEGVEADLKAIFEKCPNTVALLHDIRYDVAPMVLAGVEAFVDTSPSEFRFGTFERFAPYPQPPNLGVLYPRAAADQLERALGGVLAGLTSEVLYQYELQKREAQRAAQRAAQREARFQQKLGKLQQKADRRKKQVDRMKTELQAQRSPWRRFLRRLSP